MSSELPGLALISGSDTCQPLLEYVVKGCVTHTAAFRPIPKIEAEPNTVNPMPPTTAIAVSVRKNHATDSSGSVSLRPWVIITTVTSFSRSRDPQPTRLG